MACRCVRVVQDLTSNGSMLGLESKTWESVPAAGEPALQERVASGFRVRFGHSEQHNVEMKVASPSRGERQDRVGDIGTVEAHDQLGGTHGLIGH